jgi:hypothetical protein
MKLILAYKRSATAVLVLIFSVLLLTQCVNGTNNDEQADANAMEATFAGSKSCEGCHKDVYDKHLESAHYLSSQPASAKSIRGNFKEPYNSVAFPNNVKVHMERSDSSFYQVEYTGNKETVRQRFEMVIGAGRKGQTFLSWSKSSLVQLPVFYFAATNKWANSPGYPDKVVFNRVVTSRCMECHSTYIKKTSAEEERREEFDANSIIFGIDCEKCHGPAAQHVEFQTKNPKDTTGGFIIKPQTFSRQQKIDMCALCHGGSMNATQPAFSFKPGDKLFDYYRYNTVVSDVESMDVHGNQYGLLSLSKCFNKSEMTCNSCHSPHENERGQTKLFSQRCMSCHTEEEHNFCTVKNVSAATITSDCIGCHMPEQASKAIVFLEQKTAKPVAANMRSHFIKVYPEATKKFLTSDKKSQ